MRLIATLAVCAALLPGSVAAQADSARSPQLVKQLISAMTARQITAIAVADPEEPGRFVAALAFPEVQVLAVSAKHKAADYIVQQIGKKQFQEVYVLLQDGLPAGRLLFHDMGADGLVPSDQNVDIFYEGKDTKILFDGKCEEQKLTQAEYDAKLKTADEKYTRVLTLLLEATKKLPVPTTH